MRVFALVLLLLLLLGVAAGVYWVIAARLQGRGGVMQLMALPYLFIPIGFVGLLLLMVVANCPTEFSPSERKVYKRIGLFAVVAGALVWAIG